MLQSGAFSVDDPSTTPKEAEIRSGGDLKIGGNLIQASSRSLKTDIEELQGQEVLAKLDQLPISGWSYKKDHGKVKHIGPMAEDFHTLFKVGVDNKSLFCIDTAGVALAAIKALKQENESLKAEKDTEIAQLLAQNKALLSRLEQVESQLSRLDEIKQQITDMMITNQANQVANQLVY